MSGAAALVERLPPWVLVVGKGGVGKTTCASALAVSSADSGAHTLLLSTDPARALSDALGAALGADPQPIIDVPALMAFQLDPMVERDRFLEHWREILIEIVDRGTYLERADVASLVDGVLPGADEAMALLRLAELADGDRWQRIVVDTAPTGHTLRLLDLPHSFALLLSLLDAMQEKHRFMVRALMHRYRGDDADAFIARMRARVAALTALLQDGRRCAAVLVVRGEPVVLEESVRYARALAERGIRVGALVVNAASEGWQDESGVRELVERLREAAVGAIWLDAWRGAVGSGVRGAREWGGRLTIETRGAPPENQHTAPLAPSRNQSPAHPSVPHPTLPPLPTLTIVGGKGGVGKTTVACALALTIGDPSPEHRVLLVSTDPAPSLADALQQPIGDDETPVRDAPGLIARQIDALAAFARLRATYAARVDALFDNLATGAVDTSRDRRIFRELLALAPPGIDELYALAFIADAVEEKRFARVIVDPAPTGHLLRLLEMPAIALTWTHQLMRLMLRYRELGTLGDTAADLLSFAHRIRAVDALLRDPERASLIVVALDEPLVLLETRRFTDAVAALGIGISGVVWNRSAPQGRVPRIPLPAAATARQLVAYERLPSPRGAQELRRWAASWRAGDAISDDGSAPERP